MSVKQPTNDKQKLFFDYLLETESVVESAEKVGYAREYAYELARIYKQYFLDLIEGKLVLAGSKAVNRVISAMDSDGTTINEKLQVDSGKDILDRIGLAKRDRVDVSITSESGIVILPKKDKE